MDTNKHKTWEFGEATSSASQVPALKAQGANFRTLDHPGEVERMPWLMARQSTPICDYKLIRDLISKGADGIPKDNT